MTKICVSEQNVESETAGRLHYEYYLLIEPARDGMTEWYGIGVSCAAAGGRSEACIPNITPVAGSVLAILHRFAVTTVSPHHLYDLLQDLL